MIILFANKYPTDQAILHYIETKRWKHSRRNHLRRNEDIMEYLKTKIEKFLSHLSKDERSAAKNHFENCLNHINSKNTIPCSYSVESVEKTLDKELKTCFKDLTHTSTSQVDGFRQDVWENGDDWVDSRWKLSLKSGSIFVEIDSLRAHNNGNKGRATNFLQAIIKVLQSTKDSYAEIRLSAWTGMNTYYGLANGGYVWARLGIEYCDSKSYRDHRALNDHHFEMVKRAFKEFLGDELRLFQLYNFLNKKHDLCECKKIADECISLLDDLHTPWEFANLVVQGYPLGKFLMTSCDSARYSGIMFPNQPHSPGMIQFNKRIDQLKEIYPQMY